ncbi:bifunctional pyr operon transcriptional regulator/uracil phosphoribosyltransferase PyrR [bacterium SCSIO 12741]|nr:bifunctional pyr operon transcriptional regulator/uracil phosphoribosyltransferase PyrR [bacterium SCSIO 12741]
MLTRTLLNSKSFELTINRLCYQLIENHNDFSNSILIGLQPRGVKLLQRIEEKLTQIQPGLELKTGSLDVTFHRDDFRRGAQPLTASENSMPHLVEGKRVVLIDDVLYTGRTVRAGLDALLDYGRPVNVELLVFIDRRFSRHLPIQPDYVGQKIDAIVSERVEVKWNETEGKDEVVLFTLNQENE